jgi:dTDP-4-dehydrorhamnose 3,5-epimerase
MQEELARMCPRNPTGIAQVSMRVLDPKFDVRGSFCEIHRDEWELAPRPVQWSFVVTARNALRGFHVHCNRWDYFVVLQGHATLGLKDLRRDQASFGKSATLDVPPGVPTVIAVPPGVAHGLYARNTVQFLYGITVAWDGVSQDLSCPYHDPALGIDWPSLNATVIPHCQDLPDYATLLQRYEEIAGGRLAPVGVT